MKTHVSQLVENGEKTSTVKAQRNQYVFSGRVHHSGGLETAAGFCPNTFFPETKRSSFPKAPSSLSLCNISVIKASV